jgi:predicted transcriptional regulator
MFIYSSNPVSAVIGFAQIKSVIQLPIAQIWRRHGNAACISRGEFDAYFSGLRCGFVILLEGITSIQRKLSANDLHKRFGIVPPQSYRYVTQECTAFLENDWVQAPYRHERDNRAGRPAARTQIAG